jgi:Uma2 family endonuclease
MIEGIERILIMSQSAPIADAWIEEEDDIQWPPCDLLSDEPPLETDFHRDQIDLLLRLIKSFWQDRQDFYASGNLTIYYNQRQLKARDLRGPDFFVVLGTEKKDRKSWTVWEEDGKYPNVIVEILSNKTAKIDKGLKKQLYQDTFRTPEYFWFDPISLEFQGFHLSDGRYEDLEPTPEGWLWSNQLGLFLGTYEGKLRFFTMEGLLIATAEERLAEAEQRAQRAEQDLERLRSQLKAQGILPES